MKNINIYVLATLITFIFVTNCCTALEMTSTLEYYKAVFPNIFRATAQIYSQEKPCSTPPNKNLTKSMCSGI